MPTTLYMRNVADNETRWSNGVLYTGLDGNTYSWRKLPLYTTAGTATPGSVQIREATVNGPTNGIELGGTAAAGAPPVVIFISPAISAFTVMSGAITVNLVAFQSNAAANAAINVRIMRIDGANNTISEVVRSNRIVALGTSAAAENFTVTPPTQGFNRGDRIAVIVYADDSLTNMASGYDVRVNFDGASGTIGFSYITFSENFTFTTSASGTTYYFTNTASDVTPASGLAKQIWTSRGAGLISAATSTVTGPTGNIRCTATAGGSVLEWYTPPLQAVQLTAPMYVVMYMLSSNTAANATYGMEIAICDADGSNAVVWSKNQYTDEPILSSGGFGMFVQGQGLFVGNSQRLRFRPYIDDSVGTNVSTTAGQTMASGHTCTFRYGATAGGADGDALVTTANSLVQYVSPDRHSFEGGGYY